MNEDMTEPGTRERILQVVSMIPRGRVATYGQVAALAGMPRAARQVGFALRGLPRGTRIPWHRVINASGGISLPAGSPPGDEQRRRLEKEGVVVNKHRLSLKTYRWQP